MNDKTTILLLISGLCLGGDVVLSPGPVYGAVGGSVWINTTIRPADEPLRIIWWDHEGKPVASSHGSTVDLDPAYRDRVRLDPHTGSLELNDLTVSVSGQYRVAIIKTSGTSEIKGQITLHVIERISGVSLTGPTELLIEDQSSANLTCEGTGPNITTEWMKDGQPLSPSNNTIFSADLRSVSISPVRRSDSGEYQCRLSNPVSSDTATYTMTVNNAKSAGHKDDGGGGGGGVSGIGGVIAGIGGGVIVGFGIGSLIVFLCRKKHASDQTEMTNDQMEMDQLRNYGNDQDQHPVNINDPDPANPDQNEPNEQDIIPYSPVNTNDPDVSNDH